MTASMEFGLFDHIEGIPGTSMHQLLRDRIELVKMLDGAGFRGYHVAEHHGTDLCLAPDQEIFLAAAAEATSQIRVGPMVKLLPLHHPLRVLEDICVLDQLTGDASSTASGEASPRSSTSGSTATGSTPTIASRKRSRSSFRACAPAGSIRREGSTTASRPSTSRCRPTSSRTHRSGIRATRSPRAASG